MTERVYVSDVDVASASDLEIVRLERMLISDLTSALPGRRKKMLKRLESHGMANPFSTVPLILRYYNHPDQLVRDQARLVASRLFMTSNGELALIESVFSAHEAVSAAAAEVLDERGMEGRHLRSLYASAERLFYSLGAMEVYTGDARELFLEAIRLYKERNVPLAYENMILAHDLLKDRLEWNQNLRRYIKDVLKLAPALSQSGVQIDNIQDSLRTLADAMKSRDYRETREIVDARRFEAAIAREMSSAFSFLSKRLQGAPIDESAEIPAESRWIFDSMGKVLTEVQESLDNRNRLAALRVLHTFLAHDMAGRYLEEFSRSVNSGDSSTVSSTAQAAMGMLKIVEIALPNVATEIFDSYLKVVTGKESIEELGWPEPLRSFVKPKKEAPKRGRKDKKGAAPSAAKSGAKKR